MDELLSGVIVSAKGFAEACTMRVSVFDFTTRNFLSEMPCSFCDACHMKDGGQCLPGTAHTYGCFEAERWNGLYVYYCPLSLAFVSSLVFEGERAAYAVVTGPIVLGQLEDIPMGSMTERIKQLPQRAPFGINALSRLQWTMCMYLSGRSMANGREKSTAQQSLHNTLYELTEAMRAGQGARYPLEIEQRLQHMIRHGDKQGARELINQLLGTLYFNTAGDFALIKQRAKELIVLFSRASVDGGADVLKIFPQNRDLQSEIDHIGGLDELSQLLTAVFYRFVGYVFDFSKFEHADILHKAVGYMRENLSGKIGLEDLAEHVGLSRSYLSTILKAELGMTFTDYLNMMRIEKSKELLLNPVLSLAEIADLTGYSDQSYFTKKFAQLTGMSPGQYRKRRGQYTKDG